MKEINGKIYATKEFPEYKYRAKIEFDLLDGNSSNIDVYTTETYRHKVNETIDKIKTYKVINFKIIYWSSKEQDDASSVLVNEVLKDL